METVHATETCPFWRQVFRTVRVLQWLHLEHAYVHGKGAVVGDADVAMGTRVVLSLMSPLLDKGYCVTVDNYYNSPELVEALLERKTDVYGTARSGRKGMPSFDTRQLEKGQTEAYQKGKCLSLQWKDKKVVTFLSTVHSVAMVDVTNQRGEVASKPQIVMN